MTTVLNVKIDPSVKNKARKIADQLGLSLSGVVNVYLREFIRSESLSASLHGEEPSERLLEAMREAEDDYRHKRYVSFDTADDALGYLKKLAKKSV